MHSKLRNYPIRWIAASVVLLVVLQQAIAQPATIPESHELLNGLKILFWPKPGSPEVLVKLRIHSGSAFDLNGKAGEMALLGDILFPDPATIDYFTEQMSGKLDVTVNYDSITITMQGKADELDNIFEVLRNAILSTQLTPDVVNRVRDTRIKLVRETAISPSAVADRAIAVRLFGDFPYGRPAAGSAEDLARVDRADLMLARERFLNSNNATLAIVGGVTQTRTMRSLKQLFGSWRKSEQIIPYTFEAAEAPDSRTLVINTPSPSTEVRLAWRGISRSDKDYFATQVLAKLAQNRWLVSNPLLALKPVSARSESYVLPGIFVMGTAVDHTAAAVTIASAKKVIQSLITTPATATELEHAKRDVLSESSTHRTEEDSDPDTWLDVDTYKLTAVPNRAASIQLISAADLQRTANRIFKDTPMASVLVGDALQLKTELQGNLQVEVLGEVPPPVPTPKTPTKPGDIKRPR